MEAKMNWEREMDEAIAAQGTRPFDTDCFEFAMDFLGDPEAAVVRDYVEQIERALKEAQGPYG
jgi:hypothetical protein